MSPDGCNRTAGAVSKLISHVLSNLKFAWQDRRAGTTQRPPVLDHGLAAAAQVHADIRDPRPPRSLTEPELNVRFSE
jgi:hypothetical protein